MKAQRGKCCFDYCQCNPLVTQLPYPKLSETQDTKDQCKITEECLANPSSIFANLPATRGHLCRQWLDIQPNVFLPLTSQPLPSRKSRPGRHRPSQEDSFQLECMEMAELSLAGRAHFPVRAHPSATLGGISFSSPAQGTFSKCDPASVMRIKVLQPQDRKYPKVTANGSDSLQNAKWQQEVDAINYIPTSPFSPRCFVGFW